MEPVTVPDGEFEESAPAHYFDEEATLLARPVVPIERSEGIEPGGNFRSGFVASQGNRHTAGFLAVVVVCAGLAGAAGAMAINFYTSRNRFTGTVDRKLSVPESVSAESRYVPVPVSQLNKMDQGSASSDHANGNQGGEQQSGPRTKTVTSKAASTTEVQSAGDSNPSRVSVSSVKDAAAKAPEASRPAGKRAKPSVDAPEDRDIGKRKGRTSQPASVDEKETHQAQKAQQELNRIRDIFEGPHP